MKRSTKTLLVTVLIAVVCTSCLGWLTAGFQNFDVQQRFEKERNPENLIEIDSVSLKSGRHESGIDIDVDENGVVTLNGTTGDEDVTLTYSNVALAAGDYILTGAENGSTGTYYLYVDVSNTITKGDFNGQFTVGTAGTFNISIMIKAETQLRNVKLYPVVNEGTEAADFWK